MQTYEQVTGILLESLTDAKLSVTAIEQDMEQSTATKTFTCYCITDDASTDTQYQAVLSFQWDAIMTYLSVFGEVCSIFHDEKDVCIHKELQPEVFIELEIRYLLPDPVEGTPVQDLAVLANKYSDVIRPQIRHKNVPDLIFEVGFSEQGHSFVRQAYAHHFWHMDLNEDIGFDTKAKEVYRILAALSGGKAPKAGRKHKVKR